MIQFLLYGAVPTVLNLDIAHPTSIISVIEDLEQESPLHFKKQH